MGTPRAFIPPGVANFFRLLGLVILIAQPLAARSQDAGPLVQPRAVSPARSGSAPLINPQALPGNPGDPIVPVEPPPPVNGTIFGVVTATDNSQQTTAYQVTATSATGGGTYTASSQPPSGSYSISVPPGTYNVTVATGPNYTSLPGGHYGIAVASGANVGSEDFRLYPVTPPNPNPTYYLSGTVSMPAPLCPGTSGTSVSLQLTGTTTSGQQISQSGQAYVMASSSGGPATGSYSFSNLPPGTYTVTAAQTSNYTAGSAGATITNANVYNVNFGVSPLSFNVCGTISITNSPGASLPPGTTVYLTNLYGSQRSTSGTNGTFVFQQVPPGFYTVSIPNTADGSYSFFPNAVQIQVAGSDLAGLNFTARRMLFNVTGTVVSGGAPFFGSLQFYLSGTTSAGARFSASGGVPGGAGCSNCFTIYNVPNGTYTVKAGTPPAMSSVTPNAVGVTVNGANANAGTFNVASSGSYVVTGQIYYSGPAGNVYAGFPEATVTLTSTTYAGTSYTTTVSLENANTRTPVTFTLGASGRFDGTYSNGITPGNYTVQLSGSGLAFTPASSTLNLPPVPSQQPGQRSTASAGSYTASKKGLQGNFTPAGGGGRPQFRLGLVGKAALPVPPAASGLPPHAPAGQSIVKRESLGTAAAPSASPVDGVSPAAIGGGATDTVANLHFIGGFGPPDPNNPGYNLPDPTVPNSALVLFSGVVYAPVDGWYQFRTQSNGPVTLAVKDFPPDGPLVINAPTDTAQTEFGWVYMTGGHQYGIALEYFYTDLNSVVLDLSWQKPGDAGFSTIDDPYYAQSSTLAQLQSWFLYNGRFDNYTTSDTAGIQSAINAGYQFVRNEGCAYPYALPGTVPLYVLYNGSDNFTTGTEAGLQSAWGTYAFEGIGGYVFPNPLNDGSSVPLETWYGLADNFLTGTPAGQTGAQQAGYIFIRTEGWALAPGYCQ